MLKLKKCFQRIKFYLLIKQQFSKTDLEFHHMLSSVSQE